MNYSTRINMATKRAPSVFLAHGSPMNALLENPFTDALKQFGETVEKPDAIIMFSAHWHVPSARVSAHNRQIYDFAGFPPELSRIVYEPPFPTELANELTNLLADAELTKAWGLDHGAWSPLLRVFPLADVPTVQVSLDARKTPRELLEVGKTLAHLREKNIMIAGSGNLTHNLMMLDWEESGAE